MGVQDAKKKDSKPQPTENDLLRAAMVRALTPRPLFILTVYIYLSAQSGPVALTVGRPMQHLRQQPCVQTGVMERKLFIIPSFKIYGGVAGFFDFGPPGCAVKQNITQLWRQHFILEENMLEVRVLLMHGA